MKNSVICLSLVALLCCAVFVCSCPVALAEEIQYTFTSQTYRVPTVVTIDNVVTAGHYTTALVDFNFVFDGKSVYAVVNGNAGTERMTADSSEYVEDYIIGNASTMQSGVDYSLWTIDSRCYSSYWVTCSQSIFDSSLRVSKLTISYGSLPAAYKFHSGAETWTEGNNVAWEFYFTFGSGEQWIRFYIPAPNFEITPSDVVITVPDEQYNAGFADGFVNANNTVTVGSASYKQGVLVGENTGYARGYSDGSELGGTAWYSYIAGVAQAPIDFLRQSLSFNLLGVSMYDFVCSLLALCGVICVIKVVWK